MNLISFNQFLELEEANMEKDYKNLKTIFLLLKDFVTTVKELKTVSFKVVRKTKEIIFSKVNKVKTYSFDYIEKNFDIYIPDFIDSLKEYDVKEITNFIPMAVNKYSYGD